MTMLKNILVGVMLLTGCVQMAGCMAVVHNAAVGNLPTYAETEAQWPKLGEGKGRVVIYWPRLPLGGVGVGGMKILDINVDDACEAAITDQTFVFIDLRAGRHRVTYGGRTLFDSKQVLEFDVGEGEIKYIRLNIIQFSNIPALEIASQGARAQLEADSIHHAFKESLPLNKLPETTRKKETFGLW